jgi:hypothetical protein
MAATISVKESNGAGPSDNTITNLRFCTSDAYNPTTTFPLVKPSAGTNRSYWKSIYLNADTSPTGTINNVKFYCDGTISWTGCTVYIGTTGTYTQSAGTEGTTGNDSAVATAAITNFTSGAPKSVTGSISNPTTGKITDYVVLQVDLSTSAEAGTLSSETFTFQYDET